MTTATIYKNGFVIKDHTRPDICGELSMFVWTVSNMLQNVGKTGEYDYDEEKGYGHLYFDNFNETATHIYEVARQMLPIWANKYNWIKDGHFKIIEVDEILTKESFETTKAALRNQ